jgi:hypothetical protein
MSPAGDAPVALADESLARLEARYVAERMATEARLAAHYAALARQEAQQRRGAVAAGVVVAVILAGAAWWALAAVWP